MKKPMASCFELKLAGAGRGLVAGGGTMGSNAACLPGTTRVCDKAFCNSACSFLALTSRAVGICGGGSGLRSVGRGRYCDLKLGVFRNGAESTLEIKIAATIVTAIPIARYVRRTCLQRRPRGSKKTGEPEAIFSDTKPVAGNRKECSLLRDLLLMSITGHGLIVKRNKHSSPLVDSAARSSKQRKAARDCSQSGFPVNCWD